MGLSKLLRSAPARPTWLGCQSAWLHFRSVLTAKDLKFRFHTSALPKTWCSASTFPLCLNWQRSEVPRPHFRSALTAKNVKFRFRIRTSALPLLPNMWSSAPALPLCLYWQRSEVPLSALVLPGLPKMWSSWKIMDTRPQNGPVPFFFFFFFFFGNGQIRWLSPTWNRP